MRSVYQSNKGLKMIKVIKATGKEIEEMLLSREILRAKLDSWNGDCGYVVNDNEINFLQVNGLYQKSELISGYGKDVFNWEVIYSEGKPETIEVREPFKSFLDACEWLSDGKNNYSHGSKDACWYDYNGKFRDLKDGWKTMLKVYNAEVKTKTVRYYVDSQGNEVEVKE